MRQLFLILFYLVGTSLNAQNWQWAVKSTTTSAKQEAGKMTSDVFGNIYLLGSSTGTLTYGSFPLNPGNFLVKYDPSGNVILARNLVHPAQLISCDNSGNLYISDNYSGTVATASSTFASVGDKDILLVKLDALGNEIWARSYGGPSRDEVMDLVTDPNGYSYLTGSYKSDSLYFHNLNKIDTSHFGNFFITQINDAGNTQWIDRGIQDSAHYFDGIGHNLVLDKFHRVYVLGGGRQYANIGGSATFVAKYNHAGTSYFHDFAWSGYLTTVTDLQVDDSLNIYTIIGGGHHPDKGDLFKYDSTLSSIKWYFQLGPQYGCYGFYSPRVSPGGECFLTGMLGNGNDPSNPCYDPAVDSIQVPYATVPFKGLYDIAVLKLKNNGKPAWYATAGGAGADLDFSSHLDGNGNFYLSGVYNYTNQYYGTLNNTTQFSNWTLYSDGAWQQSFLAKLGDNNPVGVHEMTIVNETTIFPNPCKDHFVINSKDGAGHLKMYSELGVLFLEEDLQGRKSIDVSRFPAGLYIVVVDENTRSTVKKIVIE